MDNPSESWKKLPWKQFRRNLFHLQKRVFKAIREGDKRRARSLQKLILKSTAARMLAIRQVTQLNAGKKTAGIDGKASFSFEERFALSEELKQSVNNWKHSKLREIPIPKKDGLTRILKVPTLADRAWQCLVKYALELHHVDGNHNNWKKNNLLAVHESCHDYIHMSKLPNIGSRMHRKGHVRI